MIEANQLGVTKKQDTLEESKENIQTDTTLTIKFTQYSNIPHLKVSKFLELWQTFKTVNKNLNNSDRFSVFPTHIALPKKESSDCRLAPPT